MILTQWTEVRSSVNTLPSPFALTGTKASVAMAEVLFES